MPENFVQLPADSSGKKLRTWEETIGANTVQNQIFETRKGFCYAIQTQNVVPAASKVYLGILNGSGSGKTILIHRAIMWNNQVAGVTGLEITCRYVKITALSGGTGVSAIGLDSGNAAVPAQIVMQTASTTSTEDSAPNEYFSHKTSTDETVGIANAASVSSIIINAYFNPCNSLTEHIQRVTLPEGKGLALKQGTENVTAGNINALIVFELR